MAQTWVNSKHDQNVRRRVEWDRVRRRLRPCKSWSANIGFEP
jgi:hypothetical protein